MRVTINGESTPRTWVSVETAPWPDHARQRLTGWVTSLREAGDNGPMVAANYAEPRPYRSEYDRGDDRHALCVTLGRNVYLTHYQVEGETDAATS